MAFSTFRGMMAASTGVSPPSFSDTYTWETPASFVYSSTIDARFGTITAGSSTTLFGADRTGGNAYLFTVKTGYTDLTNVFNLGISNTNSNYINIDTVDTTHFVVVYPSDSGGSLNQARGQYIHNSSGTLSATVGDTLLATTGGGGSSACNVVACVLDTSNALILAMDATSSSNNVMSLVNPTTLSVTQSNTNASAITQVAANVYDMVKLSATRALVSWSDGTNLQLLSVDVVSGSSFTINAAVAVGVTGTQGAVVIGISNTEALIMYRKSSTTVGARTVTVGSGGSITINTEYTTTLTSTISSSGNLFKIASYGSDNYLSAYLSATNNDIYSLSAQVSGNVVSWDTSNNSLLQTATSARASGNNLVGVLAPISSTQLGIGYATFFAGTAGLYWAGAIDVNPTTQTWGTFAGHNSGALGLQSSGISDLTGSITACWLGTNRVFASAQSTSTTDLTYYGFDSCADSSSLAQFLSSGTATSVDTNVGALALLSYRTVNNVERILTAYSSASNTITTRVVSSDSALNITLNTSTNFSTSALSGITTGLTGYYSLIPLTSDTALFLNYDNTLGTYYGNIIQATTGALTIASTNTNSSIVAVSGDMVSKGANFLQYSVINSTNIAIIFETQTTAGSAYNLKMCILTISGTTVTAGAITNIYSGYTNASNSFGITVFPNSTGIVWYGNDHTPSSGCINYANGFTFSGSTITLGSQSTLASGLNVRSVTYGNPNTIAVSNTEAIIAYGNVSTPALVLLTYANINSITAGTARSGSPNCSAQLGLIPTDNNNNTFVLFGNLDYQQFYRG